MKYQQRRKRLSKEKFKKEVSDYVNESWYAKRKRERENLQKLIDVQKLFDKYKKENGQQPA